jgi:transposase
LQKPELFFLDSTSVKAHVSADGARKSEGNQGIGKSKGGTTSKIHMICAGPDEGMDFSITGGEVSDIKAGLELIRTATFAESRKYLAMDRGCSAYVTRDLCQGKELIAVVPPKKTFGYQWEYHRWIYAYRNEIERLFGRLKHYGRIAPRFDKLIRRYAAFVTLGLIFRFLKTYVNSA